MAMLDGVHVGERLLVVALGVTENAAVGSRLVADLVDRGLDASRGASVGLGDTAQIAAGDQHSWALRAGGTVSCRGGNWYGQLGDGTTEDRSTPEDMVGLDGLA